MSMLLSAVYFLSGLCALIYETVWIYKFSRIFGSTVFAMSFVVAMFFAGLASGSRVFGGLCARSRNPLRLYALLEVAIGAYALAFPLLILAAEKTYAGLYVSISASFALITLARMFLAFVVLFPPTVLMGGTLPVLLTHCADHMATIGKRAGLIYGLNALGAALGSFLSGYVLLKVLGAAWTNAVAALLSLAIGVLAWVLSLRVAPPAERRTRDGATDERAAGEAPCSAAPRIVALVTGCFALSGFVSMSYEVLWLRYLTFYFDETIYLYTGIITVFVLGIGFGSLVCGYALPAVRRPVAFFGCLQTGIGLLTLAALYAPVRFFSFIHDTGARGAGGTFVILLALLIVPAALMGATFPVVSRIIVTNLRDVGSRVGRAYALNTMGGILGLLCSGFVLQRFLGLQVSLYILFGVNMALAAVLFAADRGLARRFAVGAAPVLLGAAAVVLIQSCGLRLPHSVVRKKLQPNEEVVQLWGNGVRISRGGKSTFLAQGYIPMLIAPRIPRDVLGLAFGAGLSYRAARLFPEVRRLDFVDISKDNMVVALRQFPENAGLKDDPRARFIVDDAYSYAKYSRARYDLILMEPTPPRYSYQTAALYTREFYELARRRLTAGGCFAQVLSLKDFSPEETASVMCTFSSVFGHCLLWRNGWDCLMIGCDQDFHLDYQAISERLNRPDVQRTLRESAPTIDKFYILDNFLSGLLLADGDFRKAAASGTVYTDDKAGLRFTTGRSVTTANIRTIHAQLSPWRDLRKLFERFPGFEEKEALLTAKREYFMALLYKDDPREFYQTFSRYVTTYSQTKDYDLNVLRIYLLERDMSEQAEEVQKMIDALPNAPARKPVRDGR